jgi:hypothetical protein
MGGGGGIGGIVAAPFKAIGNAVGGAATAVGKGVVNGAGSAVGSIGKVAAPVLKTGGDILNQSVASGSKAVGTAIGNIAGGGNAKILGQVGGAALGIPDVGALTGGLGGLTGGGSGGGGGSQPAIVVSSGAPQVIPAASSSLSPTLIIVLAGTALLAIYLMRKR